MPNSPGAGCAGRHRRAARLAPQRTPLTHDQPGGPLPQRELTDQVVRDRQRLLKMRDRPALEQEGGQLFVQVALASSGASRSARTSSSVTPS